MGLKEPVMKCASLPYRPFSSNLQQLVTPKNCCEIRLLKLNTPKLAKGQTHLHEIKLWKVNTLYRKGKHTFCSKINQNMRKKTTTLTRRKQQEFGATH